MWSPTRAACIVPLAWRMYNIIAHQIGCSDAQMLTKLGAGGNRDYPASVKVMTPRNELRTEDKKWRMILMKAKGASFSICDLKHQTEEMQLHKLHSDVANPNHKVEEISHYCNF